ncbi:Putative transposase [Salmonella enterica subsp. houtenae serovar Houten]|nr:Putative transposase [Salmonella enterica subsp. houtenae serovar Houten]
MTIAEWLEEKGRTEGLQKGLEQGLAKALRPKRALLPAKCLPTGWNPGSSPASPALRRKSFLRFRISGAARNNKARGPPPFSLPPAPDRRR